MNHVTPDVNGGSAAYSRTLGNGLRLLETLRAHPRGLGVNEIASELAVNRTVVYRLLGTLRAHHLVAEARPGRYVLGAGLVELSGTVEADLRSAAEPYLAQLAEHVSATAFLAVADGDEAVSMCVVEPLNARMHVSYRLGTRHALEVSAAGLAILAGREPASGEREEVTRARERGYAITTGELQPGAWGLATPLAGTSGEATASIGVVALSETAIREVAGAVQEAAASTARQLVGSNP